MAKPKKLTINELNANTEQSWLQWYKVYPMRLLNLIARCQAECGAGLEIKLTQLDANGLEAEAYKLDNYSAWSLPKVKLIDATQLCYASAEDYYASLRVMMSEGEELIAYIEGELASYLSAIAKAKQLANLKANALAKLTSEEREALGI